MRETMTPEWFQARPKHNIKSSEMREAALGLKVTKVVRGWYYAEYEGISWEIVYNDETRVWNASAYDTKEGRYEWNHSGSTLEDTRFYLQWYTSRWVNPADIAFQPNLYDYSGLDPKHQ